MTDKEAGGEDTNILKYLAGMEKELTNVIHAVDRNQADRIAALDKNTTERMARIETSQNEITRRQGTMEIKLDGIQDAQSEQRAKSSAAEEAIKKLDNRNNVQDRDIEKLREEIKELRESIEKRDQAMRESYDQQLRDLRKQVSYLMGVVAAASAILSQLIPLVWGVITK